jgi:hypothetical protein
MHVIWHCAFDIQLCSGCCVACVLSSIQRNTSTLLPATAAAAAAAADWVALRQAVWRC